MSQCGLSLPVQGRGSPPAHPGLLGRNVHHGSKQGRQRPLILPQEFLLGRILVPTFSRTKIDRIEFYDVTQHGIPALANLEFEVV